MRLTSSLLWLSTSICWAEAGPATGNALANLPVTFERNQGQWPRAVEFAAHVGGHRYTFGGGEIVIDRTVHLELTSSKRGKLEPLDHVQTKTHYLTGGDSRRWITGVPNYGRIRWRNAFPGIDLILYGPRGMLEFDYIVAPGANPGQIRLRVRGASLEAVPGKLRLTTPSGELLEIRMPSSYQYDGLRRRTIDCRFRVLRDGQANMTAAPFDRTLPLIIDPILMSVSEAPGTVASAAYLNSTVSDSEGNFYFGGTSPPTIPTSPGTLRPNSQCTVPNRPCGDGFVMKFNPSLNQVVWATYFGASSEAATTAIGLDPLGNVVLGGGASLFGTPTPGAYLATAPPFNSSSPYGFLAKLSPDGASLVYGTYLEREVIAMKVDSAGAVYIGDAASVRKLSADGSTMLYTTPAPGGINQITIDGSGNLYALSGPSRAYPVTPGAYSSTDNDPLFVLKFDPQGNPVFAASFNAEIVPLIAAPDDSAAGDIAVDSSGSIVFTGVAGAGFPLLNDPDPETNDCDPATPCMAYVAALDKTGSVLQYARLLGHGYGERLALDANGDVWVAGVSIGAFPRTFDAFRYCNNPPGQPITYAIPKDQDGFVMRLDAQGQRRFSSFLGLQGAAVGHLRLSDAGDLYIGGNNAGYYFAPDNSVGGGGRFAGVIDTNQAPTIPHGCLVNATQNVGDLGGFSLFVAPGQMVTLFGEGLGPHSPAPAQWNPDGTLANSLAGVQVLFDGIPAPMLYAQYNQVNCIVPFEIAANKTTSVVLQYAGTQTGPLVFHVARSVANMFTKDYAPGADVIAINQDGSLNSADHAAPRGSVVSLFATGLGQTNPPLQDGQIVPGAAPATPGISVYFWYSTSGSGAKVAADILYQGAAPGGVAGVYQLNVRIPDNALTGHTLIQFFVALDPPDSSYFATQSIWVQ